MPKIIPISRIFDEYERLHPFVSQIFYNIRVRVVLDIQPLALYIASARVCISDTTRLLIL